MDLDSLFSNWVIRTPGLLLNRGGTTHILYDPVYGISTACYGPGDRRPRGVTVDNINVCPGFEGDPATGDIREIPMSSPFLPDFSGASSIPQGGGLIDSLLAQTVPILTALAQSGVIRGSVGQALAPQAQMAAMAQMPIAMPAISDQLALAQALVASGQLQLTAADFTTPTAISALQAALAQQQNPVVAGQVPGMVAPGGMMNAMVDLAQCLLNGGGTSCIGLPVAMPGMAACNRTAVRPNIMTAMSLFRTGCSGQPRIPARVYVDNPDGSVQVLLNAGRATRGSRERSLARRLARENGLTVGRKRRPR